MSWGEEAPGKEQKKDEAESKWSQDRRHNSFTSFATTPFSVANPLHETYGICTGVFFFLFFIFFFAFFILFYFFVLL